MAQDFRIGFVNTDRIFRESNPAKAAQTKLEAEFSKREKELADLGTQALELQAEGMGLSKACAQLASATGVSKSAIYAEALARKA